MKKIFAISALFALAASCGNPYVIGSLQDQSAGQVPCDPGQIEIIEHKINQDGSATWTGLCNGYTYQCNRLSGDNGQVSCTEMQSQMPE